MNIFRPLLLILPLTFVLTGCDDLRAFLASGDSKTPPKAGIEAKVLGVHENHATMETKEEIVFLNTSGTDLRQSMKKGDKVYLLPDKSERGFSDVQLRDGSYIKLQ